VLSEIARSGSSSTLSYVLRLSGYALSDTASLSAVYDEIFTFLTRHYRCEYVFKNAITTKLLLGRHSVRTATLLSEFRVGDRKADVVILNGTSTVYEIKTGLDNLDRLAGQLEAYRQVFDRVCVVTELSLAGALAAAVSEDVGVIALTDRYTLHTIREPRSNAENVDPVTIFGCLRRAEYSNILRAELGELPSLPNGIVWREYRKLFAKIPPPVAHRRMVEALRRRSNPNAAMLLPALPRSLLHAGLGLRLNRSESERLTLALKSPVTL
jgi:hypothetical protein